MATSSVVVNGAGAAAIACTELIKAMGVRADHVLMCDRKGVIYKGRDDLDQWKSAHAVDTDRRTLKEALVGADVFLGLSAAGALKPDMVMDMAPSPIIFAMANPDPEITPPEAKAARPDAIVATGRSDYPNQVNNVLGFPFIFRGALDVRATGINEEMKIAAAHALAELARETVPEEVAAAYGGISHHFGPDYIIPAPFDPRLIEIVPSAVAQAAMDSGVAQKPITDMRAYRQQLRARLNPTASVLSLAYEAARSNPKRVLFAEGEEPNVLRAAIAFKDGGYGTPVLVGREDVYDKLAELGVDDPRSYEVLNSRNSPLVGRAVDYIYAKHQRHGLLRREVERLVNQDRNIFAAAMLALGEGDAMITGTTRPFSQSLRQVRTVIDDDHGPTPFGINIVAGAQPDGADRRHLGHRAPDRRAAGRHRHPLGGVRAAHGAGAARRLRLATPPSAIRPGATSPSCATRCNCSTRSRPTSNMKAKWAPTLRSATRCSANITRSAASPARPTSSSCRGSSRPTSRPS